MLQKQPYKLLLISTGNINNNELENLFQKNLEQITVLLETHSYIEISRDAIIIHQ
ncbi:hypothetical protein [Oscillatoria acuminata]|uniref:hypothetical protein n=1 Tax=Oscillatoria acuminata TaxID=118323 RepID=UPI0002F521F8|nr:hypothetical protein [Oscillatoria acuminata]